MARLTKDRLDQITWPIAQIYSSIQTEILESIAELLAQDQNALEEDANAWYAMKFEQVGGLIRHNIKIIAKKSGLTQKKVREILSQAGHEGIQENETLLQTAFQNGALLKKAPEPKDDPAIWRILEAFEAQSKDIFNQINSTMLESSAQIYRDILTKTAADVLAGIKTPQQALRSTMTKWANKGIPALIKSNGDRMNAQEYAQMVIRTVGNNVTNEMQDARFDSWGVDLVEISSHSGARPKCAPYQGRIFSRSGKHPKYPPLSSTSKGQPDGLFGVNCGHFQYPFVPGVSIQRNHPVNAEKNEKAYENSQKQRYLERTIRDGKRELAVFKKLGDEVGLKRAQQKITRRQAQMRAFINETGRTRRRNREQIYA